MDWSLTYDYDEYIVFQVVEVLSDKYSQGVCKCW